MDMDSYKKVLIAGIVFTVFSNTDSYANPIDKRIPFRNNILHRGMMDYSDEEAKSVYELLVYFIAELAIMEKKKKIGRWPLWSSPFALFYSNNCSNFSAADLSELFRKWLQISIVVQIRAWSALPDTVLFIWRSHCCCSRFLFSNMLLDTRFPRESAYIHIIQR